MKRQTRLFGAFRGLAAFLTCILIGTLVAGASGPSLDAGAPEGKKRATKEISAPSEMELLQEAATAGDSQPIDTAASPSEARRTSSPTSVGDPLASGKVELLVDEIRAGMDRRGIRPQFAQFLRYAALKLDSTSGLQQTSEVTGNCRLSWYDHMLRNPLSAIGEAEEFTRQLHKALSSEPEGLDRAIAIASVKLDLAEQKFAPIKPVDSPQAALEAVKKSLADAQVAYAAALAPLSRSEIAELTRNLYPSLVGQNRLGHTLNDRSTGRRMCDLLEKMDRDSLITAARALVPLTDPALLKQLRQMSAKGSVQVEGATGTIVKRISTPAGDILIGGPGQNTYDLDKMRDVNVVIDLGGDDAYLEGTASVDRPVLIVIDLDGNDAYRGTKPGVQGGAILGISMLLDAAGDDTYQAVDVAQGSCVGGVGILIDYAGDDAYVGLRRVQGQALGGLGLLIDRAGNDDYRAALWAQGFGAPLGFGVLDDLAGDDHYFVGGLYPDSYEETPGLEGWGQGVGAGLRQVADGGIGILLEGGGDDVYEFDYLSHGGGYWLGAGFARDFAGNDQRLGATRTAYHRGPRTEPRFQRFANGWGCHYAVGFCFDDAGDDVYNGTIMNIGFGWDVSLGALCDFSGDDRYEATGGGVQGNGAQASLGILFDYEGDDVYRGGGQGRASPDISYHDLPGCGGNFSFVVDYGGRDKYGCGASNNSYTQRGSKGGFLIDRPKQEEIDQAEQAARHTAAKRATGG